MSLLIGPVSGALVAGGAYYAFSNLIQTRTQRHQRDLHELNTRITDSVTLVNAPPPAAARIEHRPFASLLESRWNRELETLFRGFHSWDTRLQDWCRDALYGSVPPTGRGH
ncbi:hypothetical protein AX14_011817 [Amanita brunnescens Koide BX004]|nr:hypothetical protein AX14_011817 [Amanita brunnescens Koide BX004]